MTADEHQLFILGLSPMSDLNLNLNSSWSIKADVVNVIKKKDKGWINILFVK